MKHLLSNQQPVAADAKQESNRQLQLRACLRVLAELEICHLSPPSILSWLQTQSKGLLSPTGVWNQSGLKDELKATVEERGVWTWVVLVEYLVDDMDKQENAFLATYIAKFYAFELMGIHVDKQQQPENKASCVSAKIQKLIHGLFEKYYESASQRLSKQHVALQKMTKYNQDYQITRGELTPQQKERFENAKKSYDRLKSIVSALSSSLDIPLPKLKEESEQAQSASATVVDLKSMGADKNFANTPWEDEEMATFYTSLNDLANFVPQVYLAPPEGAKKKKKRSRDTNKKSQQNKQWEDDLDDLEGEWLEEADEEVLQQIDSIVMADGEDDPTVTTGTAKKKENPVTVALDNVLMRLPNCMSAEAIDQAAIDFCNAQHACRDLARARLIETLVSIPRYRLDILPFYARFMALINPYMPDVSATVLAALMSEFKRRFSKQHPIHLDHRIKNVRYISELAKFRLAPSHIVFYCLHRLLRPESIGLVFSNSHAEVLCNLLEGCGRYMLKHPETGPKFVPFLEILQKKARTSNLDSRVTLMIENALLSVDPPTVTTVKKRKEKQRTVLEWFLRKLIYVDLDRRLMTVQKLEPLFRVLPWGRKLTLPIWKPAIKPNPASTTETLAADTVPNLSDPKEASEEEVPKEFVDVDKLILSLFTRIWKVKFHNVPLLADLAALLTRQHPSFGIHLVDRVLELIRQGLEQGTNYKDYQRRILCVKYLGELFNYRLVAAHVIFDVLYSFIFFGHANGRPVRGEVPMCTLDPPTDFFRIRLICTLLETTGQYLTAARLDVYLAFFQHYVLTKHTESMPLEVQFMLDDVLERVRPGLKRCLDHDVALVEMTRVEKSVMGDDVPVSYTSTLADDPSTRGEPGKNTINSSSQPADAEDDQAAVAMVIPTQQKGPSQQEEEAFTSEFQSLMTESMQSRRNERVGVLDIALPIRFRQHPKSDQGTGAGAGAESGRSDTRVPRSNSNPLLSNSQPTHAQKEDSSDTLIPFSLLTKKSKSDSNSMKQIGVPSSSKLALSTLSRQAESRREQRELKKVILEYEMRRRMQDQEGGS